MRKMKNYWAFIVFAIIGGVFGLQEFYVNRTVAGIYAVLFCLTGIPALVAFIEATVWLFRGKTEFNKKFNLTEDKQRLLD